VSDNVYKDAVMRVLPAAPEIPVEAPPTESFDMQNVQVCPACGQADAIVQEVEDAVVAKCPRCQCEFPPRMESVSRKVIRRISEHRHRRMIRLAEELPAALTGVDPTDYALFRKVVSHLGRNTAAHTEMPVEAPEEVPEEVPEDPYREQKQMPVNA
jgi:hypothetical protein